MRFPLKNSRIEPLNRSSRRKEALTSGTDIHQGTKFEPPHVGCYKVQGEEDSLARQELVKVGQSAGEVQRLHGPDGGKHQFAATGDGDPAESGAVKVGQTKMNFGG